MNKKIKPTPTGMMVADKGRERRKEIEEATGESYIRDQWYKRYLDYCFGDINNSKDEETIEEDAEDFLD